MMPRSVLKKMKIHSSLSKNKSASFILLSRHLFLSMVVACLMMYIVGTCLIIVKTHAEEQTYSGSLPMTKKMPEDHSNFQQVQKGITNISDTSSLPSFISLETAIGDILIQMRSDLSLESVEYIQRLLEDHRPCEHCRFYRAQDRGILQGIMKKPGVKVNHVLGTCPPNMNTHSRTKKCHGPIMTRGMVGWAGGGAGPDFFIDNYKRKADWWGHEHTVFGEVDPSSFHVVESFFDLPRHSSEAGGMMFLDESIFFDIKSIDDKKLKYSI
jgi:cyclophilin family peptidyl-prolyl cis-trans isomerase